VILKVFKERVTKCINRVLMQQAMQESKTFDEKTSMAAQGDA
jgi:hypothetical protein